MSRTILIVGTDEQLLSRLKSAGRRLRQKRALSDAEGVSWEQFPERMRQSAPGLAVLDLSARGALSLEDAAQYPKRYPHLRALYVVDTEQTLPERTIKQLFRPGVDFISNRADVNELAYRVERLLSTTTTPDVPQSPWARLMPEMHNPASGRLDAKRIADWFGLPLKTLTHVLSRSYATVHKTPDAGSLQETLRVYLRIASALKHLAGSAEAAKVWLNASIPDLSRETPISLLAQGKAELIAEYLEDALVGLPG